MKILDTLRSSAGLASVRAPPIYIFEEGDVWGICYSGSVCNDACRKCRNYDCEMEGIVSSIDYVNGWEKAIDLMDRWCLQSSISGDF